MTSIFVALSCTNNDFAKFQTENTALLWCMLGINIFTCIGIVCYRSVAKKVPTNYVFLFVFTLSESYIVSFIASFYDPDIVLAAAVMTLGICVSLTIYAVTTKNDFTM